MKDEKNLPKPGELFEEQKVLEKEIQKTIDEKSQNSGIIKKVYIPQYRVVERKYGGWLLVCIIVFMIFALFKMSHIQLYCMQSDSMENTVPKGSLVIVKSVDPEEIQIDDVITFVSAEGVPVTHQVVAIETDVDGHVAFRTQGTANDLIDRDVVTIGQLKGKMIKHIPGLGKIFMWY